MEVYGNIAEISQMKNSESFKFKSKFLDIIINGGIVNAKVAVLFRERLKWL